MGNQIITIDEIQNRIFTIRGYQVMLDSDLAALYEVETKVLNQAVKRNIKRFPNGYRFQLEKHEYLRSQSVTLEKGRGKHRKHLPFAFTEQGVAMLSAVLHSERAIQVSIQIMDAFVEMRHFLANNSSLFHRVENLEAKQYQMDASIQELFDALHKNQLIPNYGIFYDGQMFDAYTFVSNLIRSAEKSITLIDNYIDETVLNMFSKVKLGVQIHIYTKRISTQLQLDIQKYNSQYKPIVVKEFTQAHDRFLIIDKSVYHFGASLKDLGKKWFAFSKMELNSKELLGKLL